ncbi:hypothetical protein GGH14_001866 [Coemansia sp. RSA 370]|nr:hypothetical protein GGH14_001866 [Coemansia sp. RSA 370]
MMSVQAIVNARKGHGDGDNSNENGGEGRRQTFKYLKGCYETLEWNTAGVEPMQIEDLFPHPLDPPSTDQNHVMADL